MSAVLILLGLMCLVKSRSTNWTSSLYECEYSYSRLLLQPRITSSLLRLQSVVCWSLVRLGLFRGMLWSRDGIGILPSLFRSGTGPLRRLCTNHGRWRPLLRTLSCRLGHVNLHLRSGPEQDLRRRLSNNKRSWRLLWRKMSRGGGPTLWSEQNPLGRLTIYWKKKLKAF
jgi:hypothetical protein